MKKALTILLCFSVLLLGIQSPCRAVAEESNCTASHCCKDDVDEDADQPVNTKMKPDGSCCVYNILTTPKTVSFNHYQPVFVVFNNAFDERALLDAFLPDFWQPPRQV